MGRELTKRKLPFLRGPWYEYFDDNGKGFCQPDFILLLDERIICIETKLSQRSTGITQIGKLYKPVLSAVYGLPVTGVFATKVLRHDPGKWLIEDLSQVLSSQSEEIYTWHWLGRVAG